MAQGSNLTFLKRVFFVNSVNSILIDTFAVFRERKMWKMLLQQFTITEECWKEWKNHFDGALIIVLKIMMAVTLNTSCND
jgi:hypothetical protein